jgi:RNA polymerase sigma factor for flagellar operon FliA
MRSATKEKGRLSAEETLALWRAYKESGDARLRDRLVLTFAPMVKYIVYKKVKEIPARCEVEDFISCGLEALIRSIDRYDPEKGATLEQFAWTRIHGAVLDELRRNDWAPRSLRRWEREIVKAREAFVATHGQPPTRAQLAAALGLSEAVLEQRLIDLERSEVGSLNVVVTGEEDSISERIDTLASEDRASDPVGSLLRDQAKVRFRAAFARLPERERQVAILLYVHSLTLREIGDVLGVTESRVCQLHAQLRRHLRDQLVTEQQLFSDVA